jgi:hypothetical protein
MDAHPDKTPQVTSLAGDSDDDPLFGEDTEWDDAGDASSEEEQPQPQPQPQRQLQPQHQWKPDRLRRRWGAAVGGSNGSSDPVRASACAAFRHTGRGRALRRRSPG